MHFLPSYDEESCNDHVNAIFDNIADYVQAHYLVKRDDTPFWKEVKNNLELTPNLQNYLDKWQNRLPLPSDIYCAWQMFNSANYIPILYGLDWFDRNKIKLEYDQYGMYETSQKELEEYNNYQDSLFWIGHKDFVKQISNV